MPREAAGAPRQEALSVSAAMALAKGALEGLTVRLVGEVSEVSNKPGYKAVYFTVKDEGASLPCMMWNNRYRSAGVELRVGMLVELTGRFTLYAAKGRMNFDVFSLSLAGEGYLRLQVANLARRLQSEGLMDPARKRPLPSFPQTVGIVTSPRGAVVHDMMRTMRRRWPLARVLVAGVPVEGRDAPMALVEGLRALVSAGAEVILLGRGGGSFEDLMPFNDERLARTVAACPVPIVTGIGHEPDTTIADMVADLRASTPTAAAEAAVPDQAAVRARMDAIALTAGATLQRTVDREGRRLDALASRPLFADPSLLFAGEAQALDWASERMRRASERVGRENGAALDALDKRLRAWPERAFEGDAVALRAFSTRLGRSLPARLERERANVSQASRRLARAGATTLSPFESRLGLLASRLEDLSPLAILTRGYAVAKDASGGIVKSVAHVEPGDAVSVQLADGTLDCKVEHVSA